MLEGVVDQVGKGIEQKIAVAENADVLAVMQCDGRAFFLGYRFEQFDDFSQRAW